MFHGEQAKTEVEWIFERYFVHHTNGCGGMHKLSRIDS